jgi:hypothetical protein
VSAATIFRLWTRRAHKPQEALYSWGMIHGSCPSCLVAPSVKHAFVYRLFETVESLLAASFAYAILLSNLVSLRHSSGSLLWFERLHQNFARDCTNAPLASILTPMLLACTRRSTFSRLLASLCRFLACSIIARTFTERRFGCCPNRFSPFGLVLREMCDHGL